MVDLGAIRERADTETSIVSCDNRHALIRKQVWDHEVVLQTLVIAGATHGKDSGCTMGPQSDIVTFLIASRQRMIRPEDVC